MIARETSGKTLYAITGSGCTKCSCINAGGSGSYSVLPKNHACWTDYTTTIDKIVLASGVKMEQIKAGDPWGSPYAIDENEDVQVGSQCAKDSMYSWGKSGNDLGGTNAGYTEIPLTYATMTAYGCS